MGSMDRHHSMTLSDLEKKRWPPMTIALIIDGLGYSADIAGAFENDRFDICFC
jgi:hypothetical protein